MGTDATADECRRRWDCDEAGDRCSSRTKVDLRIRSEGDTEVDTMRGFLGVILLEVELEEKDEEEAYEGCDDAGKAGDDVLGQG